MFVGTFLVPIPSFESFDALNAHLEQHCVRRFDDRLRGHNETIESDWSGT